MCAPEGITDDWQAILHVLGQAVDSTSKTTLSWLDCAPALVYLHALDHCVHLVPSLRPFSFLLVKHHLVLDLVAHSVRYMTAAC